MLKYGWMGNEEKQDFYTAGVAQLAEHRLSKPNVTGSIPVTRFREGWRTDLLP
jgi:hypothetical protein